MKCFVHIHCVLQIAIFSFAMLLSLSNGAYCGLYDLPKDIFWGEDFSADQFDPVAIGESRPGYRSQVTPQSQAYYRYVMDKLGKGKELTYAETLVVRVMIMNRTWPDAPTINKKVSNLNRYIDNHKTQTMDRLVSPIAGIGGLVPYDLVPTGKLEKFRQYYWSLPRSKRNRTARFMMTYFQSVGYDMRSDKKRQKDKEQEDAGLKKRSEIIKQKKIRADEEEKRKRWEEQQKWFDDMRKKDAETAETRRKLESSSPKTNEDEIITQESEGRYSTKQPVDEATESKNVDDPSQDDKNSIAVDKENKQRESNAARKRLEKKIRESKREDPLKKKSTKKKTWVDMTPGERHKALKNNDPDAWKNLTRDLVGDDKKSSPKKASTSEITTTTSPPSSQKDNNIYEEEKGWVKGSKGTTKVFQTKDSQGNVIKITEVDYDNQGNVIDRRVYLGSGRKRETSADGGYNPLADQGMGMASTPSLIAKADTQAQKFQKQRPGSPADIQKNSGVVGGGDKPSDQSSSYTGGTIGGKPENAGDSTASGQPDGSDDQSTKKANKTGLDVKVVGTAPPGKCKIVNGQLVPVKGWPVKIAGMTVTLQGPINKSVKSSASGSFSFSEIPAGDYTISVKEWDYGMTNAKLKAPSGKEVKLVLKGSCPYLYVWTGQDFARENDIYSTARLRPDELIGALGLEDRMTMGLTVVNMSPESIPSELGRKKTYRDYYHILNEPRKTDDGDYLLKIVERAGEYSFTDLVQLQAVPIGPGKKAGVTRQGHFFLYDQLQEVASFGQIVSYFHDNTFDENGPLSIGLYDRQGIELKLPAEAFAHGVLAVTWQGFLTGTSEDHSSSPERPRLSLQRQDPAGVWRIMDWSYPRDEISQAMFLLEPLGTGWDGAKKVRLIVTNCLPQKFHRLDKVQWAKVDLKRPGVIDLELFSAMLSGHNQRQLLLAADNNYLRLGPNEEIGLRFDAERITLRKSYEYFFVSEGFYIPAPHISVATTIPASR